MDKPDKLDVFMRALMKEATRESLTRFLEWRGISWEEYGKIEAHFWNEYGIRL
jgi:hypothetical protein